MSTIVKYNGVPIFPTPYVGRTAEPISYGGRWGVVQNIELNGVLSGVSGTALISGLCGIFATGFKDLVIESSGDAYYYKAENCVLENISIANNPFYEGSIQGIPYTVSMKSYSVPSGVVDVVDEFSYSDSEDGTVGISRKISAKGVKTSANALDNATNFVSMFTGKNPIGEVSPLFLNVGVPILSHYSESLNRLEGTYSVSESWKYETGATEPYVTTSSLNISDDISSEYSTLELEVNFSANKQSGLADLRGYASKYNYYNRLSKYSFDTGACFLTSFSMDENESAATISSKLNFISGDSAEAKSGVFYSSVSLDWDEIKDVRSFSIESELKIKGPEAHRTKQIEARKQQIISDYNHYIAYLYCSVQESELFSQFGSNVVLMNPIPSEFSISEGKNPPTLKLSAKFDDSSWKSIGTESLPNGKSYPIGIGKALWKTSFSPPIWIFDSIPAANIEGHFIIQDLQCQTREKIQIESSVEHVGESYEDGLYIDKQKSFDAIKGVSNGILTSLGAISPNNSFYLTDSSEGSGVFTFNVNRSFFAKTGICGEITANKVAGFSSVGYATRAAGLPFGY